MRRGEALDNLLEAASEQAGYVTAGQATRLGVEPNDLRRLVRSGDLRRMRRGVYGLRHRQDLAEADIVGWLHLHRDRLPWEVHDDPLAVVSHSSAAALYNLGTIIPERPTFTLIAGTARAADVADIEIHRSAMQRDDWTWHPVGAMHLPVTTPERTIVDLILDRHEPTYLQRAVNEAMRDGALTSDSLMATARRRKQRTAGLRERVQQLLAATA